MINDFKITMTREDGRLALQVEIEINGQRYGGHTQAPGDSDQHFCQALGGVLKVAASRLAEEAGIDLLTGQPVKIHGG